MRSRLRTLLTVLAIGPSALAWFADRAIKQMLNAPFRLNYRYAGASVIGDAPNLETLKRSINHHQRPPWGNLGRTIYRRLAALSFVTHATTIAVANTSTQITATVSMRRAQRNDREQETKNATLDKLPSGC